ncbi:MAG: hypothetical protein IJI12_00495 [Atopobiaceae bacterium]|nr:hypothetical protein [Atopobiaceae bacterium]
MTTNTKTSGLKNRLHTVLSALLVMSLFFGSFALAGCKGSAEEQDNCYGEDMPVINEE